MLSSDSTGIYAIRSELRTGEKSHRALQASAAIAREIK
jgi:hypothetical protein